VVSLRNPVFAAMSVIYDSVLAKNLPSKLFNWAARKTSGLTLHDFNCGLKAYKKEVIKNGSIRTI